MIARALASVFLVAAGFASAAAADPSQQNGEGAKPAASEERICEKITVTGSRLATRKICATRAEWAERRLQDKEAVDQIQTRLNGPCTTINTHTGAPEC